jgi:hypothetical protein
VVERRREEGGRRGRENGEGRKDEGGRIPLNRLLPLV